MLAFVGYTEKFKKLKEKFCNGRRRKLNKSSEKRKHGSKKAPRLPRKLNKYLNSNIYSFKI